jgi:hypothetical protein
MPTYLQNLVSYLKQLHSLVAGALPYTTTTKLNFFPFLNPQISEDLWLITSVLSLTSSLISYNFAQYGQKPKWAMRLGIYGFILALTSFILMLLLVGNMILTEDGPSKYLAAEFAFVSLFMGLGLTLGWIFGRMLRWQPSES